MNSLDWLHIETLREVKQAGESDGTEACTILDVQIYAYHLFCLVCHKWEILIEKQMYDNGMKIWQKKICYQRNNKYYYYTWKAT